MVKEVQTLTLGLNLYFSIYDSINQGNKLPDYKALGLKRKSNLNYYTTTLKRLGFIEKIGYGTWKTLKPFDLKQVQTSNIGKVAKHPRVRLCTCLKEGEIRGHAFIFHLKIPKIPNWKRRTNYLQKKGIEYANLKNNGQRIRLKQNKVHLFNNSILIYYQDSFIADLAKEARSQAIYTFLEQIKTLENVFNVSFKINKNYVFKVCREHYAIVKNALARQYDKEHKKLYVYNTSGLWFIIDNSFNLNEAETVKLGQAVSDNKGIQNWFNEMKDTNFEVTPKFILKAMGEFTRIQGVEINKMSHYATHIANHTDAIKTLGGQIKLFGDGINKLIKIVGRFKK